MPELRSKNDRTLVVDTSGSIRDAMLFYMPWGVDDSIVLTLHQVQTLLDHLKNIQRRLLGRM